MFPYNRKSIHRNKNQELQLQIILTQNFEIENLNKGMQVIFFNQMEIIQLKNAITKTFLKFSGWTQST